ncbi:MAG: hypothetical protein WCJ11_05260 [Methylococcaceae bacterium]
MITLPLELEQQINHIAQIEQSSPTMLIAKWVENYQKFARNFVTEDDLYLSSVSDSLAEEWNGTEDNEAFRDL